MKTHGTATLSCANHPSYRWTHTKYSLPGTVREFIGRGVLMFDGEDGGKPASPFNLSEASLANADDGYRQHYLEHYTPECNCSMSDLRFVRWAD
jgi:hypothetical protein